MVLKKMKFIHLFSLLAFMFVIDNKRQVKCQTYIGHNIALHQPTSQSSTYYEGNIAIGSDRAVDGHLWDSNSDLTYCSHTAVGYSNPWFEVTFPKSNIFTIVIYNRGNNRDRLSYFKLEILNGNTSVNITQGPDMSNKDSVRIDFIHSVVATRVNISSTYKQPVDSNPILTICEIEIYGGQNIALHRQTQQSSNYTNNGITYESYKAVDGNTDQQLNTGHSCSHTNERDYDAWFEVTFPKSSIYSIVIYNRDDCCAERLSHYEIELFYNTGYVQDSRMPLSQQNIITLNLIPEKIANKARITLASVSTTTYPLTLCEIIILGDVLNCDDFQTFCSKECCNLFCYESNSRCTCQPGYIGDLCDQECPEGSYGNLCFNKCPVHCSTNCNTINGFCASCQAGYTGNTCSQECPHYFYGDGCQSSCSTNCNNVCNNVNGNCSCKPGYRGPKCDQECQDYFYGNGCQSQCSTNCNNVCNNVNGSCTCKHGHKGSTCYEDCHVGTYGPYCTSNCSSHCTSTCNKENGNCTCKPGYTGNKCDDDCQDGAYGYYCGNNCSSHCNSTCNKENGNCTCNAGYIGNTCEKECDPGKWGPSCLNNCSEHCSNISCTGESGSCMDGCKEGFTLSNCTVSCDRFHYGRNCSFQCSSNCTNETCNSRNGSCDQCYPGYHGNYCDQECNENSYGQQCNSKCSMYCSRSSTNDTQICDHINGSCFGDCVSGYTGPLCSQAIKLNDSQDPPVGVIVGVIIAAIVIILIIVAGVLFWRRRHPTKQNKLDRDIKTVHMELPDQLSFHSNAFEEISVDGNKYKPETAYYNTSSELGVNMAIKVTELNAFMKTHDKQYFLEQFKKIPQAQNVTTETALSDENKNKNRYKNICPYDHSRVNLLINKERKEGDYINASYIQDNKNKVKFIATQGPNTKMINDFIRMLWEQKTEIVVMLTNFIEEGKVKCEKYWPESGKTNFGEITVKLKKTQTFADYTIRRIELEKSEEEPRLYTHFHFTSWPDLSTPTTPWALVDFAQKVFAKTTTSSIVVHCSAGVGRTGTFIALHNILQQAGETGQVDFYNTLVKLRKDRICMIQTGDQYDFLHRAAQVAILCQNTYMELKDISDKIKHFKQTTEVSKLTNMEKQFKSMKALSDAIRQSQNDETGEVIKEQVYQNSFQLKQDVRNRFPSIVPRNCDRPYLTTNDKDMSDYINAVFVQGFQKKDHHILSQLPMPATVTDLWRLVTQYNISIMVAFETENISIDQTMAGYLPMVKEVTLSSDHFEVKCMNLQNDELWEEQTLKVRSEKAKSGSQDVVHLKCKFTNLESKYLLRLVKKIKSFNLQADGKILYMCRDGATYSGLCCVLSNLLDRLDNDSSLSVPLVVGAIKTIRPEVIPDMEQFRTVYEVLEKYSDISTPYSNVDENYFTKQALKPVNKKTPVTERTTYENVNVYNNV